MKPTGIVRKLDELGRVVIPMQLRRNLDIREQDGLEILIDNDRIILRKYQPVCVFCGQTEAVEDYRGKKVCRKCLEDIGQRATM